MRVHLLHYLQNSVETATVHEFEDQVHYTLVIVGTKKGYLKFYMLLDLNCRHKRELNMKFMALKQKKFKSSIVFYLKK